MYIVTHYQSSESVANPPYQSGSLENAIKWAMASCALSAPTDWIIAPYLILNQAKQLLAIVIPTGDCDDDSEYCDTITVWQANHGWVHEVYNLEPVYVGDQPKIDGFITTGPF